MTNDLREPAVAESKPLRSLPAPVVRAARRVLPAAALARLARMAGRPYVVPVGRVRLGDLARTEPIGGDFGYERGRPVDRYYIERFLEDHATDIRGRVLEVKEPIYTRRFGGDRVTHSDVVDIDRGNAAATIVTDLNAGEDLPSDAFDCIVLTQTLHLLRHLDSAVAGVARALRPGGVLLLTVPGITSVPRSLSDNWYWSMSETSVRALFAERFEPAAMEVTSYGNVLAATTFLHGLAIGEVARADLDIVDPEYPVIVALRAVRT